MDTMPIFYDKSLNESHEAFGEQAAMADAYSREQAANLKKLKDEIRVVIEKARQIIRSDLRSRLVLTRNGDFALTEAPVWSSTNVILSNEQDRQLGQCSLMIKAFLSRYGFAEVPVDVIEDIN